MTKRNEFGRRSRRPWVWMAAALAALPACAGAQPDLSRINLPSGFQAEVWASVPRARSLVWVEPLSTVFVGSRGDAVHAVVDADRDGRADRVVKVLSGLKVANGIAWRDGHLYVAEQHRLVRYAAPDLEALARARPEVLFDGLPDDSHHGWRYAAFGPDGRLYVSVGAPCNICSVEGLEGTIVRFDPDGGAPEVFARGVRNPVGLAFQPGSGELYFTDNGADYMGDDLPPEEFNRAPRAGLHFGYPWYGGGDARTSDFRSSEPPAPVTMPEVTFPAHVAPLGVHFYEGAMLPAEYRGDAFVAHHGSWNRSIPDGYRVARVRFENGRAVSWEVFADGFLRGPRAWGRPVDVEELPDGSLLVSDDRQGVLYRITYQAP